ncbi:hypothetical protein KUTeg_013082 [Tegillarca granosa]|uniref:Kinetochore-associated protein 1 n=1 Tax=Tegillarca granosa TaxID=220873 RepID=A0ABQ9ESN3_TEGGR|nr:hypothetical protein KUTeg_013082 [Tegillarca granosa]
MPWDIIDSDFGGDETANFGPRQESGTALYQIDTLATISSDTQTDYIPNIVTTVLGELASVAVEQHISVFKDCQHTATLGFDSTVDELEWSPDGCMLIVGEHNGRLHVVDASSSDILFAMDIFPSATNKKTFQKIMCQCREDDNYDLTILGFNGQLAVLQNINMNLFLSEEGNIASVMKENLTVKDISDIHTEGVHDVISNEHYFVTMGSGDTIIAMWKLENGQLELQDELLNCLEKSAGVLSGKLSSDGNYLFTLDSNNVLSLWSTSMLIMLKKWSDVEIEDFQLLETKDIKNNSLEGMKLVMLKVAEEGENTLMIQNLPDCETVYTLQLNTPSVLAKCLPVQETLFVAECCVDYSGSSSGVVSMVRYRCLTETNPETRMYRFLHKNKFEEAENFAKLFQLDIELVHKVKANFLLDQLSPWNIHKYKQENIEEMISQLWKCLESVKDDLHVAEMCMREALPTIEDTEKLLAYCKKRLSVFSAKSSDVSRKEKQQNLTTKIYSITNRLDTFRKAFGIDKYSAEKWEHFQKADLLKEALSWLNQGSLNICMVIWTRHEEEWDKNLKSDVIQKLLSQIPDQVKTIEILSFIKDHIIPVVSRVIPQDLVLVVNWLTQKALDMERLEKEEWPVNALQFLRSVYKGLNAVTEIHLNNSESTCTATDNANKTKLNADEILEPVQRLITNLQHLYDLITKYNCRLTFESFMQETTETVTFRMLDRVVAIELIPSTLEKQIRPYMREHNLKEDKIFFKYVKDLLSRQGRVAYSWGMPAWEPKVIAVIACITDPKSKIEAILETMKFAPIPWSEKIEEMVQSGLQLKHPDVKKIEKQCQLIEIKKIMLKYKLKNIQVSDLEFENSQRLWYFILSQDKAGCMEDALKVMEACKLSVDEELYRFRLRRLISQEKLYEYMELLNSLPSNMALTCGKRIVNYVKVLLEDAEELDPDCHKTKQVYTEAALVTSKHLMSLETDYGEVVEWKKLAFEFQNLWSLQVEYDKYLSVSQYEDEAFRMEVMVSYMKEFFIKRSKQPENSDYCYGKVYRLADILQISHTKLQGELAIKAAKTGSIETAIKMCNKLLECHPTEETAETIYQVALAFLNLQANTENDLLEANQLRDLPEITYKLACQPLSLCSSIETKYDLFSKCMELCKCAYLNLNVSRQCELGEYSFCVESSLSDNDVKVSHDKDWKIDSTFKEDALVMKSSVALPLMAKYSVAHPVLNEDDNSQVDESTDNIPMSSLFRCFIPVMQHLKDNSHILLAYQYSLHMISIATDYANRNDFDRDEDESNKFLENIEQNSQTVMKELLTNILTKIFNCNHVDHHLALAFLLSRPKKECLITLKKIISMSGHNYKKLRAVATVGLAVGQVYKEPSVITMCKQLETNAVWGYKLSKYKINFKEAFLCPPIEKIKLLPQVVQVDTGDMTLVKDFCSAFGLDTDEGIMLYLDHVFSTYNEDDHVSSSQLVNQLKNARIAIQEIKKTDSLFEKLELLYTQVHSYDYETLEFLLEEMQKIEANGKREKGLKLLDYLKVYTRTVEPSEYERKYRIDGDKQKVALMLENLPVASKTRLPFHPFIDGDPWKILTPELRKDTVSLLLPIAELLKIPVDQIYIVSVQNMVRQHLAANRRPDDGTSSKDASKWNWDVKDANLKLLDDVKDLLTNVSNCELALACASWMTLEMPAGAEKIKGLEGCLALATLWHNALPPEKTREKDKAKAAYGKFSSQWQRLSTEQALCLGKLAEPELLKLANNAEKLLQKLYEHPSILLPDGADKPVLHLVGDISIKVR